MQKLYIRALSLMISFGMSGQKIVWQLDVPSSSQDFLSNLTSTIDVQILVAGSTIQSDSQQVGSNKANNSYDYHIIKVDQQGQKLWEKYFSGNQHDYLSTSLTTKEGNFLLAGTSYSSKALDKKEQSFGGSDMWIIKLDENGNEQWQKIIGTNQNEETRTAVQTIDLGYIIAGSTNNNKLSFGQKDVMLVKLDSNGKILNQLILGGNGIDDVESIIATKDGGALLGICSRCPQYEGEQKTSIKYENFLKENSYQDANSYNHSTNSIEDSPNSSTSSKTAEEDSEIHFYAKQSENYGDGDYWIVKLDKDGKVEWEKSKISPIAKIEAAELMDISHTLIDVNASDQSQTHYTESNLILELNEFRENKLLKDYLIETYTYRPLIGVTSITPPSGIRELYYYDNANRLKEVRDINGKILKEYKYNYKQ